MSAKDLVTRIGQIATKGKHKDRFLYVGVVGPKDSLEKVFYLIEVDTPWAQGEKIKNAIVNTLGENWQPESQKEKAGAFEEAVKRINAALGELSQSGEQEWVGKLNAIIGISAEDELIFSQTGKISGYLFRGNKISHITEKPIEPDQAHPLKTFVSIISGNVTHKDKVIIANSVLYSHLSLDRLRQILTTYSYKDAIAEIARGLRRAKIKDANLIVFDFADKETLAADQESTDKPDIILLDDIPDSKLLHYSKLFFKGTVVGAKATGKGLQKFGQFWMKSIQPKISKKVRSLGSRAKNLGGRTMRPISERFAAGPKINYFNKKPEKVGRNLTGILRFLSNVGFWFKQLWRPENRKYLYIALIVILLAIGFIKIQLNKGRNSDLSVQNQGLTSLDSARDLYVKALDELGLKREGGREKLIAARDAANKALESPAIHDEAKNLLAQINAKLDELNSAIRISASKEPSFTFPSANLKIYAVGADLYLFDADNEISKFDTRKKAVSSIASFSKDNGATKILAFSDTQNAFFCYTDKMKVEKLDLKSNTISDILVTDASGKWENAASIATFSTNIYLLDAESGEIWKHSVIDNGYSKGTSYLSKPKVPIKGAVGMAIDGDVYILQADGSVVRAKKSVQDSSFAIDKPPTPDDKIASPAKIYTTADSTSVYILDRAANRLLVFSKTGSYQKQYVADSEVTISDFAVNAKIKKLWLLSDTKVFEFDL